MSLTKSGREVIISTVAETQRRFEINYMQPYEVLAELIKTDADWENFLEHEYLLGWNHVLDNYWDYSGADLLEELCLAKWLQEGNIKWVQQNEFMADELLEQGRIAFTAGEIAVLRAMLGET